MCLVLLILIVEEGWIVVLLHITLGRLVHAHVGYSFLGLSSLLVSGCLLLFLLLLLGYSNFLEFVKHILVVQEGVRELILEVISSQETFNSPLNDWHFQKLVDIGSLCRVSLQHHGDNVCHSWAEVRR